MLLPAQNHPHTSLYVPIATLAALLVAGDAAPHFVNSAPRPHLHSSVALSVSAPEATVMRRTYIICALRRLSIHLLEPALDAMP